MNVHVLLSSGEVDEWDDLTDVSVDMTLGGALVVRSAERIEAIYAGGMWMKFERSDDE